LTLVKFDRISKERYSEQNISRNASYYLRIFASLQPRL